MSDTPPTFFGYWFQGPTVRRAAVVAAVVGTLLCLINQWQAIILATMPIDWLKVVLTYFVPYAVSSYSTAASLSAQQKLTSPPENSE